MGSVPSFAATDIADRYTDEADVRYVLQNAFRRPRRLANTSMTGLWSPAPGQIAG